MKHTYQEIIAAQRTFFAHGKTYCTAFRRKQLCRLKKLLIAQEKQLLNALAADMHKPLFEAFVSEWYLCMQELDYALKQLDTWSKPQSVPATPFFLWNSSCTIVQEPRGVVLIIAPWNFPLHLTLIPLIHAIAAGNCVIIKPSEYAPHTAQLLANLMHSTFDPAYITVIQADATGTQALLQEQFDYIFFTGSNRVGRAVMQAAAVYGTPLTLELGGKNPCIIGHTADITQAAWRIMWGKFFNAGQSCIAPDYVLVPNAYYASFIAAARTALIRMYGSTPQVSPDYAHIISDLHMERLIRLLPNSTIVTGGTYERATRYFAPTLITDVDLSHPSMQEEIFGPILPIIRYDNEQDIATYVSAHPTPLTVSIFSSCPTGCNHLLKIIRSGNACINDTLLAVTSTQLPFGGIGTSGFGSYHGEKGFQTFSHYRSVLRSRAYTGLFRYPPYRWIHKKLRSLLKFLAA